MKRLLLVLLTLLLVLSAAGCVFEPVAQQPTSAPLVLLPDATQSPQPAATEASVSPAAETPAQNETGTPPSTEALLDPDGSYDTKDEVALYIHQYGVLPKNYITKKEAEALGWTGGSLEPYAPGKSIGGGYFGNYEGLLPSAPGRKYTECDIDATGKRSRGPKRIVFSNDGLIFYTDDHYESFELLYGEVD